MPFFIGSPGRIVRGCAANPPLRSGPPRDLAARTTIDVSAPTVRTLVLGEDDVQPSPAQLDQMRALVDQAMEEGALGLTTALIYAPAT